MRVSQPYARAAHAYLEAGFSPLPAVDKILILCGVSGYLGRMATMQDVDRWVVEYADCDVLLRLPEHVIALDVDEYSGNLADLAILESKYGKLPKTWNSDARGGNGGKLIFRVPVIGKWVSNIHNIVVVQHTHRYVVAPPSWHAKANTTVKWHDGLAGSIIEDEIPTVDELPMLPPKWVEAMYKTDAFRVYPNWKTTVLTTADLNLFAKGDPCPHMGNEIERSTQRIKDAYRTGLHDAGLTELGRIFWVARQGHSGIAQAVEELGRVFQSAQRGRDLGAEWQSELEFVIAQQDPTEIESADLCKVNFKLPPSKHVDPIVIESRVDENAEISMSKLRQAGFSPSQARFILRR